MTRSFPGTLTIAHGQHAARPASGYETNHIARRRPLIDADEKTSSARLPSAPRMKRATGVTNPSLSTRAATTGGNRSPSAPVALGAKQAPVGRQKRLRQQLRECDVRRVVCRVGRAKLPHAGQEPLGGVPLEGQPRKVRERLRSPLRLEESSAHEPAERRSGLEVDQVRRIDWRDSAKASPELPPHLATDEQLDGRRGIKDRQGADRRGSALAPLAPRG